MHELEEHCPDRKKPTARKNIRQVLEELGDSKPSFVRVSTSDDPGLLDDLEAIVCPQLYGITLPKVERPEEIIIVDALLSLYEQKAGMEPGSIYLMPLPESANGQRLAYEVAAAANRVEYFTSCTNTAGDPAISIGYQWTRECTETLYIRQKVVLDVRSAGKKWPVCSNWNAISDVEGLEKFYLQNRQMGYAGAICVPTKSHIELANKIFTPPQEEMDYWGEVVPLMEQHDNDVVIDGGYLPRNKIKWGRIRLALGAEYGVLPRPDRRKLKLDSVGKISSAINGTINGKPVGHAFTSFGET